MTTAIIPHAPESHDDLLRRERDVAHERGIAAVEAGRRCGEREHYRHVLALIARRIELTVAAGRDSSALRDLRLDVIIPEERD